LRSSPLFWAYIALAAVCFFWGTTYLGIRIALESFPPLVLVSLRYLLSGTLLVIGALVFKARLPRGRELWSTALFGVLTIGIGNGCLAFAEERIPSGLAALFITTSPFWMVGLEALVPGGERLHPPMIGGMIIGLLGAVLLVLPQGLGHIDAKVLTGFALLQFGCAGWSFGSILQRRSTTTVHPVVSGAIQQVATGLVYAIPAMVQSHPIHWNARGIWALLYLVTFGAIVGYSAYVYALDRLPVALVSIYNYINPIVAVTLGWLFYREPFGRRELIAMLLILAGVALVKKFSPSHAPQEEKKSLELMAESPGRE
jgi:drug/metabolite transporter (DMT)-like permease